MCNRKRDSFQTSTKQLEQRTFYLNMNRNELEMEYSHHSVLFIRNTWPRLKWISAEEAISPSFKYLDGKWKCCYPFEFWIFFYFFFANLSFELLCSEPAIKCKNKNKFQNISEKQKTFKLMCVILVFWCPKRNV